MYIMMQIIVKRTLYVYNDANNSKTHTSSNVAGMNRMRQTIVKYTHPLTPIMNIYTHHFGKAEKIKTIARSLL